MNTGRVFAIILIFIIFTIAWATLGTNIAIRSSNFDDILGEKVASTWGIPIQQNAPAFKHVSNKIINTKDQNIELLQPIQTDISVDLALDHRKKGLIWYTTYTSYLKASYILENPTDKEMVIMTAFNYPDPDAPYNDLMIRVGDEERLKNINTKTGIQEKIIIPPHSKETFYVQYKTRGQDE